ncbi:MAG: thioester reductase domain-containing protein [Azonexus sp.]|nr:thioester reductase domain-containing protein [Azonexus sp.]
MNDTSGGNKISMTISGSAQFVAARIKELAASDEQFRAALPNPMVNEAKLKPELGLAQIMATCMEGYANRPALGQRATELVTDPATGRAIRRLLKCYETLSYAELWSRARSLAAFWHHDQTRALHANDLIGIIAFAGIDFTTVDLAALHNGAVVVPMQTNAAMTQLLGIIKETEPRWLATSLECLDTSVELVLNGHRPAGVLVFDYHPEVDDEREIYAGAKEKLAAAGLADLLVTLPEVCAQGERLPPAPLFAEPDTAMRMCTIYYTSGSTGLPKGAMYPEHMVKPTWRPVSPLPFFYMHYMPMNHSFGRSGVYATLGSGGTCYFTAKSDLSELFEDIKLVRPTFMAIVPRICEMVYQQYQVELERRSPGVTDIEVLRHELLLETRNQVLGGRMLAGSFGSAPLAPELRQFMEACFGFNMDENYGCTELSGITRNNRIVRPPVIDYKLDDVPELGYFKTDKPYPRGELWVKTASMMLGYYKRSEVTATVITADGYYKTGDIMAEIGPDQLIYVDRRNNVLKLSQGEFVAISQLETLFTNGHPAIKQVYLYGTSERSFLLGVLVPNEDTLKAMGIGTDNNKAIKALLRQAIKEIARTEELNGYEIPRDFIVEREPFSIENGLLAGIGKYQRPKFKERYSARLEQMYDDIATAQASELQGLRRDGRHAPVLDTVARAVQATLGIEDIDLSRSVSFSDLGGDSLSALSCSLLLEEIYEVEVPASVINNPAGSLQQIVRFIERARNTDFKHPTFTSVHGKGATEIHASDLMLEKFIDAATLNNAHKAAPPSPDIRTVLVTGANGYLGRFLCLEWLERMAKVDGRVVCIARGQDAGAARQRIADAFESNDPDLKGHFEALAAKHLEVFAGDLSEPDLGLSHADWRRLAETVDLIVHPAAFVNHVLPYAQLFGPNVVGTAELIRLSLTHRLKPINNVSTVAAAVIPGRGIMDEDADVRAATPVRRLDGNRYADGYANSKWAAEVLLREANDRFGLPVATFRSDMILAHSTYKGQVNVPDMFTRWLLSIVLTGLAPRSFYSRDITRAHYDGLPVDFSAAAIATLGSQALSGYRTYHVVNPHDDSVSMDTFIDWAIEAGHKIQRIDDYAEWILRFETALRGLPEKQRQQSSLPLIHQLQQPMSAVGIHVPAARFRADVRKYAVGPDKDIPHLSVEFIHKNLNDLRHLNLI